MLRGLLIALLLPQLVWAQFISEDYARDFEVMEAPEKWADASCVILARYYGYDYDAYGLGKNMQITRSSRRRVLIQDRAGVNEYSELTFPVRSQSDLQIEISLIKGNAQRDEIQLTKSDGVFVDREDQQYFKVAVPSLEVGDILDVSIESKDKTGGSYFESFDTEILTLATDNPIISQTIEFKVDKKLYVNFKSMNGAPEVEVTQGFNEDGGGKYSIYTFRDTDREKIQSKRWLFEYRDLPTVKFSIAYATGMAAGDDRYLVGEVGVPLTELSEDDLFGYHFAVNRTRSSLRNPYDKGLWKTLKKPKSKEESIEEQVKTVYNGLRKYVYGFQLEAKTIKGGYIYQGGGNKRGSFFSGLRYYLSKRKIPHDVFIAVPRHISSLEDAVLEKELEVFIRVNTPEPLILSFPDRHSAYNQCHFHLEGVKAIGFSSYPRGDEMLSMTVPVTSAKQNRSTIHRRVSLKGEGQVFEVEEKQVYEGYQKDSYQNNFITISDYREEEGTFFDVGMDTRQLNFYSDEITFLQEMEDNRRWDRAEQQIQEDFETEEVTMEDFEVLSFGRDEPSEPFSFSRTFTVDGLVKKAGEDYLVSIGRFIGGQVFIDEEELERKSNIYMGYARSYAHETELNIPEGYTVEGLEKLNVNVSNETGSFIASAKIEGNVLKVSSVKTYKHNFEPAQNWPKMLEFLEAAYNFSQTKVLLRKS